MNTMQGEPTLSVAPVSPRRRSVQSANGVTPNVSLEDLCKARAGDRPYVDRTCAAGRVADAEEIRARLRDGQSRGQERGPKRGSGIRISLPVSLIILRCWGSHRSIQPIGEGFSQRLNPRNEAKNTLTLPPGAFSTRRSLEKRGVDSWNSGFPYSILSRPTSERWIPEPHE